MIPRVNHLALYVALLVVGILIVPFSSQAATLVLDPTFSMGVGFNSRVDTLAVQSDGKLLVGGVFTTYNGSSSPGLVRINVDGTIDSGFNVGAGFTVGGGAITITPRSDNRVLVGGGFTTFNGSTTTRLLLLNSDGSLNRTYAVNNGSVYHVAIRDDGKMYIGGQFTDFGGSVVNRFARINEDGSLDGSFVVGTGFNSIVTRALLLSGNKVLITGGFTTYNGTTVNRIVKVNDDGSIDPSFASGTGFNALVYMASVLADGKILVVGDFTSYNGTTVNRIARLNSDGTLDTTFQSGTGFNSTVYSISQDAAGKILVGGSFTTYKGTSVNRLIRLNSDGTLDPTFQTASGFNNITLTSAFQSDGRLFSGGNFTSYNGVSANRIARLGEPKLINIVTIDDVTSEDGDIATFRVSLTSRPDAAVTIPLSSSDTLEATVPSSITIQPDNWNNPAANEIVVTGIDDVTPTADGTQQVTIVTGDVTSSDLGYDYLQGSNVVDLQVYNQNNDPPGIVIDTADVTTGEDGDTATLRFRLLSQPGAGADVSISLSLSNTSEGALSTSTLIIRNGQWNDASANTITITGLDDSAPDGDISYELITSDPTSLDPDYDDLDDAAVVDVTLINVDDDSASFRITESGGSTAVLEGGVSDTIGIRLNAQPNGSDAVFVRVTPDLNLDIGGGAGVSTIISFTSSDWDVIQNFSVRAIDNAIYSGNTTGEVTFATDLDQTSDAVFLAANPLSVVDVAIKDDDRTSGGGGSSGGHRHDDKVITEVDQSTSTVITATCTPYLSGFIKEGSANDADQVRKLQAFLRDYEGMTLEETGIFDEVTRRAVIAFQEKYARDVLAFWGLERGTGYVFMTTRAKINAIVCAKLKPALSCPYLSYLRPGDSGESVRRLQAFLNGQGESLATTDLYDAATTAAVARFQVRFSNAILTPWQLAAPTGNFLQSSRKEAHRIMGCFEPPVRLSNGIIIE